MPNKTISAHFDSTYSLKHNNRNIIASNVDSKRSDDNYTPIMSGHTVSGTYFASIDEAYEKLFEKDWRDFQQKQRPVRRYSGTYLEWIREQQQKAAKSSENERHKNKKQHEAYEIVFQVGNKADTGYEEFPDDFRKASKLMQETADYILSLPYVVTITEKELNDPNWKPPENCIVALNCVVHNDETCPGVHFTFIPYAQSDRGAMHQNLLKHTFDNLGYKTKYEEVLNDYDKPIPKTTKDGGIQYDINGDTIYEKGPVKKGVLDWMEEIKEFTAQKMKNEYNWDRTERIGYQNHLSVLDYKIDKRNKQLENLQNEIEEKEEAFIYYQNAMLDGLGKNNTIYENSLVNYRSDLWEEYRNTSNEFWNWYRGEKERVEKELDRARKNKSEKEYFKIRADYYKDLYLKSGNLIFALAAIIMRIFRYYKYDEYLEEFNKALKAQSNLKTLSKEMSSDFANTRKELLADTTPKEFIEGVKSLEEKLKTDYEEKMREYSRSIEILERD